MAFIATKAFAKLDVLAQVTAVCEQVNPPRTYQDTYIILDTKSATAIPSVIREFARDLILHVKSIEVARQDEPGTFGGPATGVQSGPPQPTAGRSTYHLSSFLFFSFILFFSFATFSVALSELKYVDFLYGPSGDPSRPAGSITIEGQRAAKFPGPWKWYYAIRQAHFIKVGKNVCAVAACLSSQSTIWARVPPRFKARARDVTNGFVCGQSDHITLMAASFSFMQLHSATTKDNLAVYDYAHKEIRCKDHFLDYNSLKQAAKIYQQYNTYMATANETLSASYAVKDALRAAMRPCRFAIRLLVNANPGPRTTDRLEFANLFEGAVDAIYSAQTAIRDPKGVPDTYKTFN
ncbi:hypothetical protein F4780DRAFT_791427 [Xylariomycetidae sp. FL0641]|nr:hypothetical protein F4780DRAFT_791427 [Xylariomycetidae sp. FL0641]